MRKILKDNVIGSKPYYGHMDDFIFFCIENEYSTLTGPYSIKHMGFHVIEVNAKGEYKMNHYHRCESCKN